MLIEQDHVNARVLAEGMAEIPGLVIEPESVETNLVFFGYQEGGIGPAKFVGELAERGILIGGDRQGVSRACTHHQISAEDVKTVLSAMREVAAAVPA